MATTGPKPTKPGVSVGDTVNGWTWNGSEWVAEGTTGSSGGSSGVTWSDPWPGVDGKWYQTGSPGNLIREAMGAAQKPSYPTFFSQGSDGVFGWYAETPSGMVLVKQATLDDLDAYGFSDYMPDGSKRPASAGKITSGAEKTIEVSPGVYQDQRWDGTQWNNVGPTYSKTEKEKDDLYPVNMGDVIIWFDKKTGQPVNRTDVGGSAAGGVGGGSSGGGGGGGGGGGTSVSDIGPVSDKLQRDKMAQEYEMFLLQHGLDKDIAAQKAEEFRLTLEFNKDQAFKQWELEAARLGLDETSIQNQRDKWESELGLGYARLGLDKNKLGIEATQAYIDALSSTNPLAAAGFLQAGGGNLWNAYKTGNTAITPEMLALGADALKRAQYLNSDGGIEPFIARGGTGTPVADRFRTTLDASSAGTGATSGTGGGATTGGSAPPSPNTGTGTGGGVEPGTGTGAESGTVGIPVGPMGGPRAGADIPPPPDPRTLRNPSRMIQMDGQTWLKPRERQPIPEVMTPGYATGTPGYVRDPMAIVGDSRNANPFMGRPNPEIIVNPTRAPIRVVPMIDAAMRRYAFGTASVDEGAYAPPRYMPPPPSTGPRWGIIDDTDRIWEHTGATVPQSMAQAASPMGFPTPNQQPTIPNPRGIMPGARYMPRYAFGTFAKEDVVPSAPVVTAPGPWTKTTPVLPPVLPPPPANEGSWPPPGGTPGGGDVPGGGGAAPPPPLVTDPSQGNPDWEDILRTRLGAWIPDFTSQSMALRRSPSFLQQLWAQGMQGRTGVPAGAFAEELNRNRVRGYGGGLGIGY